MPVTREQKRRYEEIADEELSNESRRKLFKSSFPEPYEEELAKERAVVSKTNTAPTDKERMVYVLEKLSRDGGRPLDKNFLYLYTHHLERKLPYTLYFEQPDDPTIFKPKVMFDIWFDYLVATNDHMLVEVANYRFIQILLRCLDRFTGERLEKVKKPILIAYYLYRHNDMWLSQYCFQAYWILRENNKMKDEAQRDILLNISTQGVNSVTKVIGMLDQMTYEQIKYVEEKLMGLSANAANANYINSIVSLPIPRPFPHPIPTVTVSDHEEKIE